MLMRKRAGDAHPASREKTGEEDRDRRGAGAREAIDGLPGVKRSDRHEQHMKAALHAAQAWVAWAHTRAWAMCHGSEGSGARKTARLVIASLLSRVW